jgi:hypothetical protein
VGASNNSIIVESDRHGWLNHQNAVADRVGKTPGAIKTLYLSGWIAYEEASRNARTTFFRRIWSHTTERFIPNADPDDEKTY